MTTDQIKAMSDEELDNKIWLHDNGVTRKRRYSTDLNAAWPLQWTVNGEWHEWGVALSRFYKNPIMYPSDPRRCARLICEAWLWLKTKGE